MADDTEQEQRTLPPTPRRLEQAREEGQIARSRELAGAASVAAAAGVLYAFGPAAVAACERLLERGLSFRRDDAMVATAVAERFGGFIVDGTVILVPLMIAVALAALGASLAIGGWLLSSKAVTPDPGRLSPLRGLGNIFSKRGLAELGKALLKALVVSAIAAAFIWNVRETLASMGALGTREGLAVLGVLGQQALLWLAGALTLIAVADVPLALWQHHYQLRMTPEEYRRELRESEGDPQLKARIRSLQREAAKKRMMAEVPKADVVVTNPTHYSVALAYREGRNAAPRVVAKGQGFVAQRIRELAAANAVPRLEAPPLARALYFSSEIGDDIPVALYDAVAQVLAWVYQVRQWRAVGGAAPVEPRDLPVPADMDKTGAAA
jgi:flagellar biosynthetic protein FlhB